RCARRRRRARRRWFRRRLVARPRGGAARLDRRRAGEADSLRRALDPSRGPPGAEVAADRSLAPSERSAELARGRLTNLGEEGGGASPGVFHTLNCAWRVGDFRFVSRFAQVAGSPPRMRWRLRCGKDGLRWRVRWSAEPASLTNPPSGRDLSAARSPAGGRALGERW